MKIAHIYNFAGREMTVADLKDIVNSWPEEYEDGTPCTVWMETGRELSSPVKSIKPLNAQYVNIEKEASAITAADILFSRSYK